MVAPLTLSDEMLDRLEARQRYIDRMESKQQHSRARRARRFQNRMLALTATMCELTIADVQNRLEVRMRPPS